MEIEIQRFPKMNKSISKMFLISTKCRIVGFFVYKCCICIGRHVNKLIPWWLSILISSPPNSSKTYQKPSFILGKHYLEAWEATLNCLLFKLWHTLGKWPQGKDPPYFKKSFEFTITLPLQIVCYNKGLLCWQLSTCMWDIFLKICK